MSALARRTQPASTPGPAAAVDAAAPDDSPLERRARAHRLLLEAEVRLQTGAERDEEAIVPLAADLLRDVLGGDPAIVCYTFDTGLLADGQREVRLRWRYGYGSRAAWPGMRSAAVPLMLDGDIAAQTARSGEPWLMQQTAPPDREGAGRAADTFSILSVPICADTLLLGVLNAYRPAALPFNDDDIASATIFAGGVAVALLNARLNARLIETEARARALVEQSPDTILVHTADGRIMEANTAAGMLLGADPQRIVGTNLAEYLPDSEHTRLREQFAATLTLPPPHRQFELRYHRPDGTNGHLQSRTQPLHEAAEDGSPLLQTIARDVTAEFEQRQALETKVRELDLLINVGENLNSSLQLESVLKKTLRALTAVVACPTAAIRLYDESRQLLLPVGVQGWPMGEEAPLPLPIGHGPIGAAVLAGRIVFLPDTNRAAGIPPMAQPQSPRAMLIVPFMRGKEPLGCFTLLRPHGERFSDEERRLAAAVARQTAIAIENARLFGRVQRQLKQITELQGITADLVADLDLDPTLDRICRTLASLLGAEKTAVRFLSDDGEQLALVAHHGLSPAAQDAFYSTPAEVGEHGEALRQRECIVTPDLRHAPPERFRDLLLVEGIVANCTVPIIGKGRAPLGVLNAAWTKPHQPRPEEIELVRTYANYAAAAIENARLYNRTRELYLAGVQSLAATVDARDAYTHRHSRNVAFYAREMGRELGLSQEEIETIELAALLHDIGKIGISDAILGKPGKLSTSEMSVMITHATQGAAILSVNAALERLVPLVRHHHEWFNGSGYPDRLAGDAIPIGAAIIGVADAFDTMTTDRAYRRARTLEVARAELAKGAGKQFHPRVVEAFLRVIDRDGILGAAYLQHLRERGTASLASGMLTLVEAGQADHGTTGSLYPPATDLPDAGQIRPQHLKELTVLHHLARTVGSITDLKRFLDSAVDLIRRELGYADCAILLREEETNQLVIQSLTGFDASFRGRRFPLDEGLLGEVVREGLLHNVPDTHHDSRYTEWLPTNNSALLAPLIDHESGTGGQAIGVVVIESSRQAAFSAEDEMTLETIANQLTTGIAVARLHDREKRAAITDGLTGVYNHRYFYQKLEQELSGARAASATLTILIMDVNGLKALNDTHGHLAGDSALRIVASILRDCTRESDTVARYGGDEFAVILPGATAEEARRLSERMRMRLLANRTASNGIPLAPITVSVGGATYPSDGPRAATLVAVADERMYAQKHAGRAAAPPSEAGDGRTEQRRRVLSQLRES
jgi:diguanylate cyclase (GGDEF)-like protein/PAS domain S-box-containing protein/putative nucleotidyltransferase with HDIG domain